jgi:hypothetical protein
MTTLGYRIESIIDSYINGQRKQMVEQYKDACKAFDKEDVLLMLQLSDEINNQQLIKILITILKEG